VIEILYVVEWLRCPIFILSKRYSGNIDERGYSE
jgi:hypothetical protein